MPAALAIPAIMGAIGVGSSVASGVMGANAAKKASKAQEDSAKYAADLQKDSADKSLAFQKQVYSDQQANQKPYQDAGTKALGDIASGSAAGGQFTKTLTADNFKTLDPGYDFRMSEGLKAMNRAQAAGGSIGSGGALKAATEFGQDYASNEFSNAWQRFKSTQDTNYNRLASLAGVGQTATQSVNASGTAAANNISNINSSTAANMGNDYMAAGDARASGYMGAARSWGGMTSSLGNISMSTLSQIAKAKGWGE